MKRSVAALVSITFCISTTLLADDHMGKNEANHQEEGEFVQGVPEPTIINKTIKLKFSESERVVTYGENTKEEVLDVIGSHSCALWTIASVREANENGGVFFEDHLDRDQIWKIGKDKYGLSKPGRIESPRSYSEHWSSTLHSVKKELDGKVSIADLAKKFTEHFNAREINIVVKSIIITDWNPPCRFSIEFEIVTNNGEKKTLSGNVLASHIGPYIGGVIKQGLIVQSMLKVLAKTEPYSNYRDDNYVTYAIDRIWNSSFDSKAKDRMQDFIDSEKRRGPKYAKYFYDYDELEAMKADPAGWDKLEAKLRAKFDEKTAPLFKDANLKKDKRPSFK